MKYLVLLCPFIFVLTGSAQKNDNILMQEVDSLLKLSKALARNGELDKAAEICLIAEESAKKMTNIDSVSYASICYTYGRILVMKEKLTEAEPWLLTALNLRQIVLDSNHSDIGSSLVLLGILYSGKNEYKKAESYYLKAKINKENALGKDHKEYATIVNQLGMLYLNLNNFETAELYMIEAKNVREKVLGKDHLDYCSSVNSLANFYFTKGEYEKAELLSLESAEITKRLYGPQNKHFATSLFNLANIYWIMGQFSKAEELALESNTIIEQHYGKENLEFADGLNILYILYSVKKEFKKAESILLESQAIRAKILGRQHATYGETLHNLCHLYFQIGQFETSENYGYEALAIWENAFGKNHPKFADTQELIASCKSAKGQFGQAENMYLECKSIREKYLGTDHPTYLWGLLFLGNFYHKIKKYSEAENTYQELANANLDQIKKGMFHLSQDELNNYKNKFIEQYHVMLSFKHTSGSPQFVSTLFDNCLLYKGFLLNSIENLQNIAIKDSSTTLLMDTIVRYKRQLAIQFSLPLVERDSLLIENISLKTEAAEKKLAQSCSDYSSNIKQLKWQDIQKTLKPGEAIIEFIHYNYGTFKKTDSTFYAALVLKPGMNYPEYIPLFEENSLYSILNTSNVEKNDFINYIYQHQEQKYDLGDIDKNTLYELIWKPIEHQMEDVKKVYFSPSGLLHLINLRAIPTDTKEILSDRHECIQLTSSRKLVSTGIQASYDNYGHLYGGIQYEKDSLFTEKVPSIATRSLEYSAKINFNSTTQNVKWYYLKATEKEISTIEPIMKKSGFKTKSFKASSATENIFKINAIGHSRSPRLIHLATHGYFFSDTLTSLNENRNKAEGIFLKNKNPMMRSGLIMAGANDAWQGKKTPYGQEDGILTAYEISLLNLSGTELVVLSACETGLGDIQGNEGVFGLQRAFKIAGAKYIIMSLWQVPDKQTSNLMISFYKKWLLERMTIPEAFHSTQKEFQKLGYEPYQWAGFVLIE